MFFKKKYTPKTDLQIADNAWQVSQGQHQGSPLIARVNTWAKEILGHPEFPYRVGIAVPFLSPQADGLPTKEENFGFNEIEDEIFDLFQKDNEAIVCVIITTSGMREFLIYSSTKEVDEKVNQLKSKFSKYDFQSYVQEDKKWDGYKEWVK
jgi:hypothetical protein